MQTLTKREKILLYVLLCIIIFAGGLFWMLLPALEKHTTLKADYDTAQLELQSAKASIINYGDLDKQLKETSEELKDIKNKFYEEMSKEDVDNLITSMTIEHGLTPVSLSIAEADKEDIVSYTEYQLQQKKGASSKSKDGELKVYNVNLSVSGAISDVQTLVDDVRTTKSLKVSGITYSEDDEEMTTTITFKLFMI